MYRPLPKQIEIGKSSIHGLGLFATEYIPKNIILGVSHVADYDQYDLFPDGWIRTPLGGFYNHSMVPNCELIDGNLDGRIRLLKTITDIKRGEELTCTYTLWKKEDVAQLTSISKETWLGL